MDTFTDYSAALLDSTTGIPKSETGIKPPSEDDILRYRYHHGANLGSAFVLEMWLTPSMYAQGANSSELAAVTAAISLGGVASTQKQWDAHWASMLSDSDLDWLANTAHCTSIRLPIGYWDLGPEFCEGTPFDGETATVYVNAWTYVKRLIMRAHMSGIGVLIDFHALPGGANCQDHSGTNSGKAELWSHAYPMDLAIKCLLYLTEEISSGSITGVIGLQLCNEAIFNAPGLYAWYDKALTAIAQVDPNIPIYISDAWDLPRAVNYARTRNTLRHVNANPVIVDTHCYWCFSDPDKAKSPQELIADVPGKLDAALNGVEGSVTDRGASQVTVGEYSCVMDGSSWNKAKNAPRADILKQFGQVQCHMYQQRSGGAFFWCAKMDWMPGGEWGFVEQTKSGAITAPPWLLLTKADINTRVTHAMDIREQRRHDDISAHVKYWFDKSPQTHFQHKNYTDGWDTGFADAKAFFVWRTGFGGTIAVGKAISADKIGNLEVWIKVRMVQAKMSGEKFAWEWEQGFRKGVAVFYDAVGI